MSSKKYIYFFGAGKGEADASPEMVQLLGNKGAHLHEMTSMGLPVPPGFTITTEVCGDYFDNEGKLPDGLLEDVRKNVHRVEEIVGNKFGDSEKDPLLVSARSGAAVSMPGMMETILNLGLTDKCIDNYVKRHGNQESPKKFILDCYRRLYEMYGQNVYEMDKKEFRVIFDNLKKEMGVPEDTLLTSAHLTTLVDRYKAFYQKHGAELPQDPFLQLEAAIKAVEESAMGEKARNYRKTEKLPEKIYTGVNVQTMVYGNENNTDCGTGVGFTRDPATGTKDRENPYGEFLIGGQGEDVVSGRRNVFPISEMKRSVPQAYEDLRNVMDILEKKTRKIQDFEFTVWRGKLYMLQTRDGKLTGRGNVRSAYDMVKEGLIDAKEAILRVTPDNMQQLLHHMIDYDAMKKAGVNPDDLVMNPGKIGVAASPGGGVGRVVFDMQTALDLSARGEPVVLVRVETDPADYAGMVASQAVATSRGGKTSHAAVVARNKGIPCAAGTGIDIDEDNKVIRYTNRNGKEGIVKEGDFVSVDGSQGKILNCRARLTQPSPDDPDLKNFMTLLFPVAKMRVYANANDDEEAMRALEFGAEGVGLARTERMFLEDKQAGENRARTIQTWVLADDPAAKQEMIKLLEPMQTRDFAAFYLVMKDKPVIIRLMDYPLHELLSDAPDHLDELSKTTKLDKKRLMDRIESLREKNPMLGQRSIRLAITQPSLFQMQVRSILNAALQVNKSVTDGRYVTPNIEISMVFLANEVKKFGELVAQEAAKLSFQRGGKSAKGDNRYRFGIMLELAGATFEAGNLAQFADFGSFGTNDLTQTTMGWSREDGNTTFLPKYVEDRIVEEDPFITIDKNGPVAKAMALAVTQARAVKPDFDIGICGEHAADPASLEVAYGVKLTNVSPGPNQVPIAWLRSAQLSLTAEYGGFLKEFAKKLSDAFSKVTK